MIITIDHDPDTDITQVLGEHVTSLDLDGESYYGHDQWYRLLMNQNRSEWIEQLYRFDPRFQLMVEFLIRKHLVEGIKPAASIILTP